MTEAIDQDRAAGRLEGFAEDVFDPREIDFALNWRDSEAKRTWPHHSEEDKPFALTIYGTEAKLVEVLEKLRD